MGEVDKIIGEFVWTGLGLYILSIFITFFDVKIGKFLKQVSYLFVFSILLVVGSNIYSMLNNLTTVLDNISKLKVFNILRGG